MTDLPGPPGAPQPPEGSAAVARPSSVDNSFWAGVASPVIGLIAAALELFGAFGPSGDEAFMAQMREQMAGQPGGQAFTPEQMEAVYRIGMVVAAVFLLVLAGLWIMFLLFMRGGRNWARVVITVVGAIWLLFTLPQVFGPVVVLDLLAVLQLAAIAATIAFAYLTPSNQYFQAVAARRRGGYA
ncbi:hypothetical protein [Saccharopolyspora griseoalba]|uniref:DUF2127 domain-containing protein n=1 Tax=Saccharopolyspora griseoalba TaxID=1431848 RepID=A0ABW2LJR6_9PSEU